LAPLDTEKTFLEEPVGEAGPVQGPDTSELPAFTPRRMLETLVVVGVLIVAIYFLLPKLVGLGDALGRLDDADPVWIGVGIAFNLLAFATYVALFRGVVGGDVLPLRWGEAYEITMAGLAATRFFSAAGAGGIVLSYWALRKAGMEAREVGRRMVAFLALQYAFYPAALIVFGILLRTGVLPGENAVGVTIVPAAIAGVVVLFGVLLALIPEDIERRIAGFAQGHRRAGLASRLARIPATAAEGLRTAFDLIVHPSRGGLAVVGAAGFWAANIGILWASFKAFGLEVPIAVVVQGFFIGMVANLIPFAPGGVGAVDAGMIGAFVLFGLPDEHVFPAVLTYRLIAFWMPIPPGVVAFLQLRKRVHRWEVEGLPVNRTQLRSPQPVA
jgi:uncharacterized protein (TIRG00374 family)